MKVKEIVEILIANDKNVTLDTILSQLDNIGIEDASEDTEIEKVYCQKLAKYYGVDLKPVKPKKAPKKEEPVKVEVKVEEKKEEPKKVEIKSETKKVEPKKAEVKAEVKKPEPKKEEKAAEKKVEVKAEPKKVEDKPVKKDAPVKPESVKAEVKVEPKKVEPKKQPKKEDDVKLNRVYDDVYTEYERKEKTYSRLKNVRNKKSNKNEDRQSNYRDKKEQKADVVYYVPGMTAGQLADALGVSYGEIVKKLVMLGYMVAATQPIDRDVIEILADDYHFTLKDKVNTDITKFEELVIEDDPDTLVKRPPIVTIMGHVDHGKTTLLDTIRNTHVTLGEAGGITQHIGAYQVEIHGEKITFIDTPGHAAFTEMRARGAMFTDIVVLVVAADDGVMPQTKEAIDHAMAAKVPIIVAINKIDKPQANPDRIKQELTALNLVPSEWGGDTEFIPISALNGKGVNDLLETILMVAEIKEYKANPNRLGYGTVIEAQLTKGRGPVATLLVKNGTIKVGDPIVVGTIYGKIRAMTDETKAILKQAGPSKAVEVTGLEEVPQAGDHFMIFEDEKTAKLVSVERVNRANDEKNATKQISLAAMFENLDNNDKEINLIIKADVQGSVEALTSSLNKLDVEGVKINIIRGSVGAITDNDLSLAVASKSIIIGFNIRPNAQMTKEAKEKGIEIRLYNIIYKLLEDITAAMKGLLDPVFEEKVIGELDVRKIFKVSRIGTIAGSYVNNGLITRNSKVRLIRDGVVIYTGEVGTLRRGQDDVKEVKQGFECGVTIQNFNDIKEGDVIETFIMEKVEVL